VGVVAADGRAALLPGGDDPQPSLRECGDQAGRPAHRHRRRTGQLIGYYSLHSIRFVCTGAFLYAPYSFLLISNKFWMGGRVGGAVRLCYLKGV
jgi:hypothetical protein